MEICSNLYGFMWRSMTANNCNTYYINGSKRILIDPGHLQHFEHVMQGLKKLDTGPEDIDLVLCTHAHPDHIESVSLIKRAGARFALHQEDWELAKTMISHPAASARIDLKDFTPDFFLQNGDLQTGDIQLQVVHTPGHSPGSLCFYWPLQKVLISGDLVFNGGVGRTDLPGGDSRRLKQSIEEVASLPITYLLPGHGDIVSGPEAVEANFKRIGQVYLDYF